jgi:hypothetical protein
MGDTAPADGAETPITYDVNEGVLKLGLPFEDRSLNVLGIKTEASGAMQAIISRDRLEGGETLAQSVARQLRTLQRQVKQFVIHHQSDMTVSTRQWPAVAVHSQFSQGAQHIEQVQIAALVSERDMLIFTLSAKQKIHTDDIGAWVDTVRGFEAR